MTRSASYPPGISGGALVGHETAVATALASAGDRPFSGNYTSSGYSWHEPSAVHAGRSTNTTARSTSSSVV